MIDGKSGEKMLRDGLTGDLEDCTDQRLTGDDGRQSSYDEHGVEEAIGD